MVPTYWVDMGQLKKAHILLFTFYTEGNWGLDSKRPKITYKVNRSIQSTCNSAHSESN